MGLFGKLKFWKKEDELDFDTLADKEMGKISGDNLGLDQKLPGLEEKSPFPEEPEEPFSTPRFQPAPSRASAPAFTPAGGANRDLELINSKLDTLKAILNSMDQRIAHMEQTAGAEKKPPRLW